MKKCHNCDLSDECQWGRNHPNDVCAAWAPMRNDPSALMLANLAWFVISAVVFVGLAWVLSIVVQ